MASAVEISLLRTAVNLWSTTFGFEPLPTSGPVDAELTQRTLMLAKLVYEAHQEMQGHPWLQLAAYGSEPAVAIYPAELARDIHQAALYPNTLLPAPPKDPHPPGRPNTLLWLGAAAAAYYFFFRRR